MFEVEITVFQGERVNTVRRTVSAAELQSLRHTHGSRNVALVVSLEALEPLSLSNEFYTELTARKGE